MDRACPHPAAPALIHHPRPPTFHHPTPPGTWPAGPCIPGAGSGLSLRPARSCAPETLTPALPRNNLLMAALALALAAAPDPGTALGAVARHMASLVEGRLDVR